MQCWQAQESELSDTGKYQNLNRPEKMCCQPSQHPINQVIDQNMRKPRNEDRSSDEDRDNVGQAVEIESGHINVKLVNDATYFNGVNNVYEQLR